MSNKNMTVTIEVTQSPQEVFNCLSAVTHWWSKDFKGHSKEPGDEFIIHHPNQHYSKQKLVEVIADKKVVWLVEDSMLYWLQKNKQEWTNTRMIFDIESDGDKTILHFTHEGLTPDKECFAMCQMGWNMIISEWLYHYINYGTESKAMNRAGEIRDELLNDNALNK